MGSAPLFPALRSAPNAVSMDARQKQIPSSKPNKMGNPHYGYRNVYELHELVKVSDPRIKFEGTIVEKDGILKIP